MMYSYKQSLHANNFDFLRFLFALFVVISHAYPLSGTSESKQWIYQLTNGQIVLARLGLGGFFVISGYFIFKSLQHSNTLLEYLKKRFLRLFPALFIVLVLTLMLIPLVYEGDIPFYLNTAYYTYLPNNLSLYLFQPVINGVFDGNHYHSTNGSLWTIRYEFSMYIGVAFLFYFRNNDKIVKVVLLSVAMFFLMLNSFYLNRFSGSKLFGMNGYEFLDLGAFFVFGSTLAVFDFGNIKRKSLLLAIVLLLLAITIYFNMYSLSKHILLSMAIILLGFMPHSILNSFGKFGDSSYGIYIYSFPIQQALMYYFNMTTYYLMVWSVIISIAFGYVSWHLIEKRVLSYKNISFRKFFLYKVNLGN